MATRKNSFVPGEYYHIYNRGANREKIFHDPKDYRRFLQLLYVANSSHPFKFRPNSFTDPFDHERGETLVSIGAYCLMPNHYHLLLTPCVEGGVSNFMLRLGTGYSMYINKRHERSGTLFEGPFKSQYCDDDQYLKYLYAYIHLNPFRSKTTGVSITNITPGLYQYSSLDDYLGEQRIAGKILDQQAFPEYFRTASEHLTELEDWLQVNPV